MEEHFLPATTECVQEIAQTMLLIDISPGSVGNPLPNGSIDISAVIGFSGGVNGAVRLAAPNDTAIILAGSLMGEPQNAMTEEGQDAFAELCNMVAGGIKNRVTSVFGQIDLTPPTVVTGKDHQISGIKNEKCFRHQFLIENSSFFIEILYMPN